MALRFYVKIESGYAKLIRDDGGSCTAQSLCSNAVDAYVSGDEVHVTTSDGQVKFYSLSGTFLGSR